MHADLEESGLTFVGPPALITAGINKGAYAVYFEGFDGFCFEISQKPRSFFNSDYLYIP